MTPPPDDDLSHLPREVAGRIRGNLWLPKSQRHLSPPAFAAWLVEVARRVTP